MVVLFNIETYSDGGCFSVKTAGSVVTGGLGVVIELNKEEPLCLISITSSQATNNKMELLGAMLSQSIGQYVLGLLETDRDDKLILSTTSDSEYTIKGINEWLPNWKKRNWRTASNQPVKNCEYWKVFDRIISSNTKIKNLTNNFKWVRGHNGHIQNELCDRLAEAYKLHDNIKKDMDIDILNFLYTQIEKSFNGKNGLDYTKATVVYINMDTIFSYDEKSFYMDYTNLCDRIAELLE